MTAPTIRTELAAAVRAVNAAYSRLPEPARKQIEIHFDGLDREVDAAILADDRERALRAIAAWRQHWLHEFGGTR
jgi:hypothetical protein